MDEFAKSLGFESAEEMHNLISKVNLSTPNRIKAFQEWKDNDGTKKEILKL